MILVVQEPRESTLLGWRLLRETLLMMDLLERLPMNSLPLVVRLLMEILLGS